MNSSTFSKIQQNAAYLRRLHESGNLENYELFDEPYKLAIAVLDFPSLSDRDLARQLGRNWDTIRQVRAALEG